MVADTWRLPAKGKVWVEVRQSSRHNGFTLVELLVVVSIIALLMAILLPVMRSAREQSKQVGCRKNMTDLWRGVLAYSFENNDRAPYLERVNPLVDPYDKSHAALVGNVLGPYVVPGTFVCPGAVAGVPETDPNSKRRWKLTYDFSTADLTGKPMPYDRAQGAYSGEFPDPAVVNSFHFDGRPIRMIGMGRDPGPDDSLRQGDDRDPNRVEVIWTVSVPLIADRLGESSPGDLEAGKPRYPHRGLVRRQSAVLRSIAISSDARLVSGNRPGYFQLHAEKDRADIFLTRYSPDMDLDE